MNQPKALPEDWLDILNTTEEDAVNIQPRVSTSEILNNLANLPKLNIPEQKKKENKISTVDLRKSPKRRGSLF